MKIISLHSFIAGLVIGAFLLVFAPVACTSSSDLSFASRLLPAPKNGGFAMDDYWIWGSSVIKGDDGKYHMFADRWTKNLGFGAWVTNSEVVHAVSDTPEGPYTFSDVALPARGAEYFDGLATHNPRLIQFKGKYYLYYFGTRYDFPVPTAGCEWGDDWFGCAWMNKRIGVASSTSLYGPWERMDKPVLEPRPGMWDASITSNPSPVVNPVTGKILLMYKSSRKDWNPPLLLGVAEADHPQGEYKRLSEHPIFSFETDAIAANDVEDPFVWWQDGHYELIMKDRFGHICGEEGGGVHAVSPDGINWTLSDKLKAYSRKVLWDDGTTTLQANFERPFLLFENGVPTHLFAATGSGSEQWQFAKTWNMVIPLKK